MLAMPRAVGGHQPPHTGDSGAATSYQLTSIFKPTGFEPNAERRAFIPKEEEPERYGCRGVHNRRCLAVKMASFASTGVCTFAARK